MTCAAGFVPTANTDDVPSTARPATASPTRRGEGIEPSIKVGRGRTYLSAAAAAGLMCQRTIVTSDSGWSAAAGIG